jgi:hypothetical protein
MPSPFPGMDPYLEDERVWPAFQHQLVSCLHQILLPGLAVRYHAGVCQRRYTDESAALRCEDYVEIREREPGTLVTLLDVVSPANKTTAAGRQAYLDTRREGRAAKANLVEMDLVLQGRPTLEYSRDGLPEWDYAVTVTRATQPDRHEIYTATLQKPLPRFRLPLAGDDRDTVLNLHAAFGRAFDQGDFAGQVDYRREPPAPLSEKNRLWVDTLLKEIREREPAGPSEQAIARAAYLIWLKEGCPMGLDQEHWFRAEEQLKRNR